MIPTSELAKAVEQALGYLNSTGEVAEAEVFASSNRNLITRLNYTSHIPCNGVEEAKSTESNGIGIQAVFRTDAGIKIGFGSEPSDLAWTESSEPWRRPGVALSSTPSSLHSLNPRASGGGSAATTTRS